MKKYFFVFILFLIMIITVSAKNVNKRIVTNNLNSNNLLEYLKENNIKSNNIKICNIDYCAYLKYQSLEKSVSDYIESYANYVKEKTDDETSVRVSLKGFLITEITY